MSDPRTTGAPRTVYLQDYRPPDYRIDSVDLHFVLGEEVTQVRARLRVSAAYDRVTGPRPLVLDGEDLVLRAVAIDGRALTPDAYQVDGESLTLPAVPDTFELTVETEIRPQDNTSLEGLYRSSGNFCTQCEAEGFRKITYFLDRPDVMARYTTTIEAERARYPVLLSNGNLEEAGETADGRHWARWHDPFPKPCYLFALVAGDLAAVEDHFVTRSGRRVELRLYVQSHNLHKCSHAMESLKRAMAWDEEVYGREYDLDIFMIVAVDDFNMGAMENKGLNIFNSKCVLADPQTATDADFVGIEGIIGHEYFHNWSGNRVTCRDWFQLSLKEGFTVFRDQEFSADMGSRAVKRIGDVNVLRTHQFREDGGPMAHPVRPASYQEISNFYTLTVYNKGAEVVRMLHHLLGPEGFRRGTDLYFARHDGQAVTTDDFVRALEDANGADFGQFRRWYDQAGTPEIRVTRDYDAAAQTYDLTLTQSCPDTPGQSGKAPFHIPVAVGLLDGAGRDMAVTLDGEATGPGTTHVLELREAVQTFRFSGVVDRPVPSLLRGFSAPVRLMMERSDAELAFLLAHDSDAFNRWDAGQQLALRVILAAVGALQAGTGPVVDATFSAAFRALLADRDADQAFLAQAMSLPSEGYVAESMAVIDPQAIQAARLFVRRRLAADLREELLAAYADGMDTGPYSLAPDAIGRRSLRNLALGYLMELDDPAITARCVAQFADAGNMTDAIAALTALANRPGPEGETALADFYGRWQDDPLVVDKWFGIQATARLPDTLERVQALTAHPAFTLRNPNRVRSLVGAFAQANPAAFHRADGAGYRFVATQIRALDPLNPQVAARLAGAFTQWRRYDAKRQQLMRAELEQVLAQPGLSRDLREIVSKSLA